MPVVLGPSPSWSRSTRKTAVWDGGFQGGCFLTSLRCQWTSDGDAMVDVAGGGDTCSVIATR
ncbi:hypothetical protein EYF80_035171 [Liparis tanakae]|uniref:Uncharacterized protein n=1 Tax=Liparis tanakae TaxID=230148 RepID=A0A4Z2GMR6_9TELE|nr:hypothetical protein EYF80_035171 [Liparis tanakae]